MLSDSQLVLIAIAIAFVAYAAFMLCKDPSIKKARFHVPTFVFYSLAGCPHCENLKPEWRALEEDYDGNVSLRQVEATDPSNAKELRELGVESFPTLLLFLPDGQILQYTGPRDAASIAKFLKTMGC